MASIRRHPNAANRWQVRYRDPEGRQRTKNFGKKADAEKFAAIVEADKLRGNWTDPRLGKVTFEEWCLRHQQGRLNLRESTRVRDDALIRSLVLPHLGKLRLRDIQPVTLRSWVAELDSKGYAPATLRKAYQLATAALDAAVEDGLIPKSPARGVSLPKPEHHEMRFLDGEEIAALADAIDPRYRAMVLSAAYTGLRFGELAALRLDRVDFLRRSLRVEETLTEVRGHLLFGEPKTRASRRSVSLPAFLVDALAAHIAEHGSGSDSELIFTSPEGKPLLRRTHFRRRVWKPAVAASVGEPCRVHDLRH